jgi:hypothetical protein
MSALIFLQPALLQYAREGKPPGGFDGTEAVIDGVTHETAKRFDGKNVAGYPQTSKLAADILEDMMPVPGSQSREGEPDLAGERVRRRG